MEAAGNLGGWELDINDRPVWKKNLEDMKQWALQFSPYLGEHSDVLPIPVDDSVREVVLRPHSSVAAALQAADTNTWTPAAVKVYVLCDDRQ